MKYGRGRIIRTRGLWKVGDDECFERTTVKWVQKSLEHFLCRAIRGLCNKETAVVIVIKI